MWRSSVRKHPSTTTTTTTPTVAASGGTASTELHRPASPPQRRGGRPPAEYGRPCGRSHPHLGGGLAGRIPVARRPPRLRRTRPLPGRRIGRARRAGTGAGRLGGECRDLVAQRHVLVARQCHHQDHTADQRPRRRRLPHRDPHEERAEHELEQHEHTDLGGQYVLGGNGEEGVRHGQQRGAVQSAGHQPGHPRRGPALLPDAALRQDDAQCDGKDRCGQRGGDERRLRARDLRVTTNCQEGGHRDAAAQGDCVTQDRLPPGRRLLARAAPERQRHGPQAHDQGQSGVPLRPLLKPHHAEQRAPQRAEAQEHQVICGGRVQRPQGEEQLLDALENRRRPEVPPRRPRLSEVPPRAAVRHQPEPDERREELEEVLVQHDAVRLRQLQLRVAYQHDVGRQADHARDGYQDALRVRGQCRRRAAPVCGHRAWRRTRMEKQKQPRPKCT
mmetsp:Transcript_101066/g.271717  ORF Transcript_101066/g.271717 Transcript_101066/m.271717 type:complete len:445 (-) Transcript_101066:12-1346(-)